jgi:hypothetical protein
MSEIVNFDRPYLQHSKASVNYPSTNKYLGLSVVDNDIDTKNGKTTWNTAYGKISINFNITEESCNDNPKNSSCICKPTQQKIATMDKYHNFNGYYCSRYLYINKN